MARLRCMLPQAAALLAALAMGSLLAGRSEAQQFAGLQPYADQYGGNGPCPACGGGGCPLCAAAAGCEFNCGEATEAGETLPVGSFIDTAIPLSRIRVRYDRAINWQRFDRAAYFFPTTVTNGGQLPADEGVLDLEEITTTIEVALTCRFSAFVDLPARLVTSELAPEPNGGKNRDGFGDLRGGGKLAIIARECEYFTAQVRVYTPTGDAAEALGTGHTSLEAGFLYWSRWGERWTFEAEVLDWIALNSPRLADGSNFTGNVIQYGMGIGFDLLQPCDCGSSTRLALVAEFIGWTVLDGYESDASGDAVDAVGNTIVNGFYGVRLTHNAHSVYAGYGHAISSDYWYNEIARLEYEWRF